MKLKTLKKELIQIAHSYNVKCRFRDDVTSSYAWVHDRQIVVLDSDSKVRLISEFFHELGHVVDYDNGYYPGYYAINPTKKYIRRFMLKAELHTDLTGSKLMKQYYPQYKFSWTYKYKKWQVWAKKYWEIEE